MRVWWRVVLMVGLLGLLWVVVWQRVDTKLLDLFRERILDWLPEVFVSQLDNQDVWARGELEKILMIPVEIMLVCAFVLSIVWVSMQIVRPPSIPGEAAGRWLLWAGFIVVLAFVVFAATYGWMPGENVILKVAVIVASFMAAVAACILYILLTWIFTPPISATAVLPRLWGGKAWQFAKGMVQVRQNRK